MKTLVESLFGDNIKSQLSVEKVINHLSNKDIAKLTQQDILQQFHILMESCDEYTADEMLKHPVDLQKQIIMLSVWGGRELKDYVFIFSKEIPGWGVESQKSWIDKKRKNWSWIGYSWRELDWKKDWQSKVHCMDNVWLGSNNSVKYYVLPEKLSRDLIKVIWK